MSETVPHPGTYCVPLGSTYNLVDCAFSHQSIFTGEYEQNAKKQRFNTERWQYKKVKSTRDALRELGFNSWLQTKDTPALGGVKLDLKVDLKHEKKRKGTTEHIVGEYEYVIETESLATTPQFVENWQDTLDKGKASHFVRGITYGAKAVFLLTFTSHSSADTLDIDITLKTLTNPMADGGVEVKKKSSTGLEDMELKIDFWALPSSADGLPTTVDDILGRVKGLKAAALAMEGGRGAPISLELQPLNFLDASFPIQRFPASQTLERIIDDREELQSVQKGCSALVERIQGSYWNVMEEEQLAELADKVFQLLKVYNAKILTLNPASDKGDAMEEHFREAVEMYQQGVRYTNRTEKEDVEPSSGSYLRRKYSAELTRLRQHVESYASGPKVRVSTWYEQGKIWVSVYECRDLPVNDRIWRRKSDAYVQVELLRLRDDDSGKDKPFFSRTTTVKQFSQNDPVFNETFRKQCHELTRKSATIRLRVFDRDILSRDDLLGEVTIPNAHIYSQRGMGRWYHLQTRLEKRSCVIM